MTYLIIESDQTYYQTDEPTKAYGDAVYGEVEIFRFVADRFEVALVRRGTGPKHEDVVLWEKVHTRD